MTNFRYPLDCTLCDISDLKDLDSVMKVPSFSAWEPSVCWWSELEVTSLLHENQCNPTAETPHFFIYKRDNLGLHVQDKSVSAPLKLTCKPL